MNSNLDNDKLGFSFDSISFDSTGNCQGFPVGMISDTPDDKLVYDHFLEDCEAEGEEFVFSEEYNRGISYGYLSIEGYLSGLGFSSMIEAIHGQHFNWAAFADDISRAPVHAQYIILEKIRHLL